MYAEILSRILQAAVAAVASMTRSKPTVGHVCHIDARELSFPLVAAAHNTRGAIRRLVLGCDPELARQVIDCRNRSQGSTPSPTRTAGENPGFQLVYESLHRELVTTLGAGVLGKGFLQHDSEKFRVKTDGIGTFYTSVATADGELHLVIDLATQGNERLSKFLGRGDGNQSAPISTSSEQVAITSDRGEIASILADLASGEKNVLIKLARENDKTPFYNATVFADPDGSPVESIILSSPCLLQNDFTFATGQSITLVFTHQKMLLQCVSSIVDLGYLALGGGSLLPVLHVAPPREITPGQRRRSSRIVPATRLLGTIRTVSSTAGAASRSSHREVTILVKDLSDTGVCVAMSDQTILSQFKWGNEVSCTLKLPEPYGQVEVRGIIERILLNSEAKQKRKTQLGIGFIMDQEGEDSGLETIRQYLREQDKLARQEEQSRLISRTR